MGIFAGTLTTPGWCSLIHNPRFTQAKKHTLDQTRLRPPMQPAAAPACLLGCTCGPCLPRAGHPTPGGGARACLGRADCRAGPRAATALCVAVPGGLGSPLKEWNALKWIDPSPACDASPLPCGLDSAAPGPSYSDASYRRGHWRWILDATITHGQRSQVQACDSLTNFYPPLFPFAGAIAHDHKSRKHRHGRAVVARTHS